MKAKGFALIIDGIGGHEDRVLALLGISDRKELDHVPTDLLPMIIGVLRVPQKKIGARLWSVPEATYQCSEGGGYNTAFFASLTSSSR